MGKLLGKVRVFALTLLMATIVLEISKGRKLASGDVGGSFTGGADGDGRASIGGGVGIGGDIGLGFTGGEGGDGRAGIGGGLGIGGDSGCVLGVVRVEMGKLALEEEQA
ncbi:hypothetical protein ACB092_10G084000 [Castanea dentata]